MDMRLSFDQQTDYSSKQLYSFLADAELPEYVKTAEVDDMLTLGGLPKEAFADSERRIYPLNSPSRVFVSNAYFLDKQADIKKIYGEAYVCKLENRIKEAADIFGITEDLEAYSAERNQKTAADYEPKTMCNFKVGDQSFDLYVVKTASDLEKAAEDFVSNIRNFPFETRVDTCKNMVKAAEDLNVDDLPDLVCKYAGMFYPDLGGLDAEIWRRSTKLKKQANVKLYNDIRADLSNMTSMDEVMKLAEVLYHVENMEGAYDNVKVASLLGDPVDKIFTLSIEKTASELNYIEMSGNKYKFDDLCKVGKDTYEEAFGMELDPNDFNKLADVLPTMPRSDVKLFEELSGVRPI